MRPNWSASFLLMALVVAPLVPNTALAQAPPPPPPRQGIGRTPAPPPPQNNNFNGRPAPPPIQNNVPAPPPPQGNDDWHHPRPPERGPSGPVPGMLAPPPPGRHETAGEIRAREERERQLRLQDEERERSREERIRKEHEDMANRYRSQQMTVGLTEEWQRYSERKATIERLRVLAVAQGRTDATKRCDDLLGREEARHNAWLSAHPRG